MNYFFIEYISTDMMPGNWEWYLDTYVVDAESGRRNWLTDGKFEMRVYEVPAAMKSHALTAITYAPPHARKYSGKSLPAPPGVRWGIITCLRRDFFESIGPDVFSRSGVTGTLRDRKGVIIDDWVPILIKNEIQIDPRGDDGAKACMALLDGQELYASARFSLVLREDIYARIRQFRFSGCKTKLLFSNQN